MPGSVEFYGVGGMGVSRQRPKDSVKYEQLKQVNPDVVIMNLCGNDIHTSVTPRVVTKALKSEIDFFNKPGVKTIIIYKYFLEICVRGCF